MVKNIFFEFNALRFNALKCKSFLIILKYFEKINCRNNIYLEQRLSGAGNSGETVRRAAGALKQLEKMGDLMGRQQENHT